MDEQPDLFSGEATDWRAFWPAPGSNLRDAAPSDSPCRCDIFFWKYGRRTFPKAHCVSNKAFLYKVNHLILSLCYFHASQLARRKGVVVSPEVTAMAAMAEH
jgi:hypothetical protein